MTQEIDTANLSAEAAVRLRALFEASAAAARQGGGEAEESFLIGLAGLMQTFAQERTPAGEPLPKPVTINPAGGVDVSKLPAAECLMGGQFLVGAAERFHAEGFPALGDVLAKLAELFAAAVRHKVGDPGGSIH